MLSEVAIIKTGNAPKAIGPYSQAVLGAGLVFVSGQLPLRPEDDETANNKLMGATIEEQTSQCLRNVDAILKASGSGLDKVLKTTVYLANLADFGAMNAVYASFFVNHQPARATVEVGQLPNGALIEIDAIALAG